MLIESKKILTDRVLKYGLINCLIPEKPLQEMTSSELQDFVTAVYEASYDRLVYDTLSSSYMESLKNTLNDEISRRLAEKGLLEIYNWFDNVLNKEKWGGEVRYLLFCRFSRPSIETTNLLRAIKVKTFMTKFNMTMLDVLELLSVTSITYVGVHSSNNPADIEKEVSLLTFLDSL